MTRLVSIVEPMVSANVMRGIIQHLLHILQSYSPFERDSVIRNINPLIPYYFWLYSDPCISIIPWSSTWLRRTGSSSRNSRHSSFVDTLSFSFPFLWLLISSPSSTRGLPYSRQRFECPLERHCCPHYSFPALCTPLCVDTTVSTTPFCCLGTNSDAEGFNCATQKDHPHRS